jgi:serine protease Do
LPLSTTIPTQAPVNPGDSGGPLLNDEGAVVGILVGSATETAGVYFAAVQHVREVLPR